MFGRNIVVKPIWDVDNPRAAALLGQELLVNSIWSTIQGEGPHAGCPAIFVRLTGCNLRCHFCDTEFESGKSMTIAEIVKQIKIAMEVCPTDLIVLTGGEPLRQQIIPFLTRAADEGWYTQIETAGTVWPPDASVREWRGRVHEGAMDQGPERVVSLGSLIELGMVELVCSPKTPKVHPEVEAHCDNFKYIIRKGETDERGLPNRSTQMEGKEAVLYRPHIENVLPTIWLQPMTEYRDQVRERLIDGEAVVTRVVDDRVTRENTDEVVRLAMKHNHRISLQQHRILGVE